MTPINFTDDAIAQLANFEPPPDKDPSEPVYHLFQMLKSLAIEVRDRRAADPTPDEVYALKLLRRHMPMWFREDSDECGTYENRARAVLDRLIVGHKP